VTPLHQGTIVVSNTLMEHWQTFRVALSFQSMVIRMNAVTTLSTLADATLVSSATRTLARNDAELARALVERLSAAGQRSTSEMLHELRRAFPDAPLAVRVAALDAIRAK
jgi:hypothetical protein